MVRLIAAFALALLVLNGGDESRKLFTVESPFHVLAAPESRIALTMAGRPGDLIELTAVIAPDDGEVRTLRPAFYDGERTTMVLPGQPGTRFHFRRDGDRIMARVETGRRR